MSWKGKISILLIGLVCWWVYYRRKKLKEEMKKISWSSKIIEILIHLFFSSGNKKEAWKEIALVFIEPMIVVIKLLLKDIKKIIGKTISLVNKLYKYMKNINLKGREKIIFAQANLCSSSLLKWAYRKGVISEEKIKKIWELLTNSPDGIDNFYVKNFGSGSMNSLTERMLKATAKQLEELMRRVKKMEKFIKELEKGTEFEGEFDKNFPRHIKFEEEKWEHYEIRRKILNKEIIAN